MMKLHVGLVAGVLVAVMMVALCPEPVVGATAAEIDRDVDSALQKLYDREPSAKVLSKTAKAILVFPSIVKGGLIIGGQYGEGALREEGKTAGYYSTV
ncbi:MAG: twin-arginine translocation pathway signal protein, partial [Chloroflexota bacterium]